MTAAWTAPRDWATGNLITASDLNTHLRDNLDWLKTPPTSRIAFTTLTNTTSTSFVTVTGMTITITTTGGRVLVGFTGIATNSGAGNVVYLDIGVDGTLQGDATNGLTGLHAAVAGYVYPIGFVYLTDVLSAGSHIFTLRWKVSAGTGTLSAGGQFFAREV